ncbi:MAG: hypothetical protein Q7S07_03910 [Candidatus Omnitrophota bacterium]|nr:hypothetical protein [Candidatus Omnitrophota bacterium]
MRKMAIVFAAAFVLIGSSSLFAIETRPADNSTAVDAMSSPGDTVFNRLSSFFSEFDKTFTRRGNKQGFWNATGDWLRNINKQ